LSNSSPTRRYARSLEPLDDDDDYKTTLWVRGSAAFPLVPKEPSLPLVPRDRTSDSRSLALSTTVHPAPSAPRTLTRFPLAYVLSTLALAVAGFALYFARTTPPEPARAATAAPPKPVDVVAPAPAAAPLPTASATRLIVVGKPPIDVMSLPVAPSAPASRARPRIPSNPTPRPAPDPSTSP
jgi:hypothetical protein